MRGWGVFAKSIVIVGVTFMRVTFLVAHRGVSLIRIHILGHSQSWQKL